MNRIFSNFVITPALLAAVLSSPLARGADKKPAPKNAPSAAEAADNKAKSEAPAEAPAPAPTKPAVEFNASDVWNVDIFNQEDHKVLVLQDRKYTKAKKIEIGVKAGVTSASPFYNTYSFGLHSKYHFSEYLGVEGYWAHSISSTSPDKKQLDDFLCAFSFCSDKEYQKPTDDFGLNVVWSPIYGKFAFFRRNIIHFDVYASAGLSILKIETNIAAEKGGQNQTRLAPRFSVGAEVFTTAHTTLRLEMANYIYRTRYAPTSKSPESTLTRAMWQFMAGFSFLFGGK